MQVKRPQRKSRQRDTILMELRKVTSHPTAAELYEMVRKVMPNISMGTVYRNLEQLTESDEIQKLENGTSVRFDGNAKRHHHIRCQFCDRVADVHELSSGIFNDYPEKLAGYKVIGCNIEFSGICPDCMKEHKN